MTRFRLAINEGGVEKVEMQLLLIMSERSRFLLLFNRCWWNGYSRLEVQSRHPTRNSNSENCNWRTWRTILKTINVLLKNNTIIHPCCKSSSLSVLVESFTWLLSQLSFLHQLFNRLTLRDNSWSILFNELVSNEEGCVQACVIEKFERSHRVSCTELCKITKSE